MTVQAFRLQVPSSALIDLRQRLERTRWPDEILDSGWDYGTNLAYLKGLVEYWRKDFNWRAQERLLNSFPQFKADVNGLGIHFVHQIGKGPKPVPLILSHGWPGSFFEMYKIIGPLSDPARYGGDPVDAFHVIVPSLPGFGFSDRPRARGMNIARIADIFARLMVEVLGYSKFGAQGGDKGCQVTVRLAYAYPEKVIGIHLNTVPELLGKFPDDQLTEAERERMRETRLFFVEESGYRDIQSTKPQTLAYGLND